MVIRGFVWDGAFAFKQTFPEIPFLLTDTCVLCYIRGCLQLARCKFLPQCTKVCFTWNFFS